MAKVLLNTCEVLSAIGLESVLKKANVFKPLQFVSTATTLKELKGIIAKEAEQPDLVVLDVSQQATTFHSLYRLKSVFTTCKTVLWVNEKTSIEFALQIKQLGVRGIIHKDFDTELQVKCLQSVTTGGLCFQDLTIHHRQILTVSQALIVSLLTEGRSNPQMARMLGIVDGTVKSHLSRIFQILGIDDRCGVCLWGINNLTAGQLPSGSRLFKQ